MSTINYTYNVIVDRFRQFAAGHFQLRRFTHGEISQADLEKEAEWPWLHVKPRAINYSPGTRSFSFEIFISDLPRDKEDKTGYQAESITDCSLIFQDLINEIYLGNMFGDQVVLSRPVNSEPFVEQYTHTLTGVTGTIELNLDYDWSACSIPASWNYNTPTDSPSDGWGALQFIESLDQNGVFVSLDGDVEAPGNSYYYGTDASGVKGWYAIVDNIGLTCETLPDCAVIISIEDDIAALQTDVALKANTADLGAVAFSNDYNDLDNKPTIPPAITNTSELVNDGEDGINPFITAQDIPSLTGYVPYTGATADVDLGTYNLTADHIALNVTSSGAGFVVGASHWNNTIGSSETLLKGGTVALKNGVDLVARVVNKVTPNTTLTKAAYQAVRVSGAQGQRLAVALAQANNDNNSADTIGIVCETIATNQEGFIQTVGQLEGVNTTGSLQGETWADGDVLYLSPTTAGALTNIKPTGATGHIVVIGYVEYAHANNGKIYVKIMNGWELDELHNVYITSPANNNVLTYESSTSLWKNKTVETALGYTPVPTTRTLTINGTTQDLSADRTFTIATGLTIGTTAIASGTVGRVLFEGTGNVLQESANLFWDNTNARLGIGTATPSQALSVQNGAIIGNASFGAGLVTTFDGTYINLVRQGITTFIGSGSSGNAGIGTLSNAAFTFFTNNGAKAQITAGGNFLIGTTTDAGYKLDVNGTARVGNTTITGTLLGGQATSVTGSYSIAYGVGSTATADYTFAFGRQATANAEQSFAIGGRSRTYLYGQFAQASTLFSSGNYSPFYGIAQASTLTPFRINTSLTSAASLVLSLDGTGTTNLIIPDGQNRVWNVVVDSIAVVDSITGTATGVSIGDVYRETKSLVFKRRSGTSSIVGTVDTTAVKSDTSMSTSIITITAGASQQMQIQFTAPTFAGGGSVFFKVMSRVSLVELTYT